MNQRAVQHPRHDLHVAVRMGLEPRSGRDGVVVADDEHAMVGIGAQRVDARVGWRSAPRRMLTPGRTTEDVRIPASLSSYLMNQVKSCSHGRPVCQVWI